jgi:hypothetical protein
MTLRGCLVGLLGLLAACGSSRLRQGPDAAGIERPDGAGSAVDAAPSPDGTPSPDVGADAASEPAASSEAHPGAEVGIAPPIDAPVDLPEAGSDARRDAGSVPYRAVAISAEGDHVCVLLDDGNIKCWGFNIAGQLGYGDTYRRGAEPSDMGDALPVVDLGSGRTATAVASGGYATCAILDDGSVKCWGDGNLDGDPNDGTPNRGDQPGEMGDALPALDLGPGRRALQIAVSDSVACALLDDGSVRCWGKSAGSLTPTPVALGTTAPVRKLSPGEGVLALFSDGTAVSLFARSSGPLLAPGARATELHGNFGWECALVNGVISCGGPDYPIAGADSFFHYSTFDGNNTQIDYPGPTPLPPLFGFGLGSNGMCAIFDGGVVGCQRMAQGRPCTPDWCVTSKAPGDGTIFIQLGQPAKALASGTMCALLMNGEVRCWDGAGYSPTNPDDLLGSSFDFTEKNGQFSYGPFHSIDLGHH